MSDTIDFVAERLGLEHPFTLEDLMRRLSGLGHSVTVDCAPRHEGPRFTLYVNGKKCGVWVDDPLEALCEHLNESRWEL